MVLAAAAHFCAGAHLVALFHAIELVEDLLQFSRRDALAFVQDLQADRVAVEPALDADGRPGR